jgi:hypothetical protein
MSSEAREQSARRALQQIGLEIADRWASGFENRPTQQLVLQKIIDPAVKHILNTIFPWVVGVALLFLVLLICSVVTTVILLRTPTSSTLTGAMAAGAAAGILGDRGRM